MSFETVLRLLAERFRSDAARFRELGQETQAALLERVAFEIEDEQAGYESEPLTIAQGSEESGYSESHLYHLLQTGTVPNAGAKNAPRIRRRDLPRKGTRLEAGLKTGEPDFACEILQGRMSGSGGNRPCRPVSQAAKG